MREFLEAVGIMRCLGLCRRWEVESEEAMKWLEIRQAYRVRSCTTLARLHFDVVIGLTQSCQEGHR